MDCIKTVLLRLIPDFLLVVIKLIDYRYCIYLCFEGQSFCSLQADKLCKKIDDVNHPAIQEHLKCVHTPFIKYLIFFLKIIATVSQNFSDVEIELCLY